MLLRYIRGEGYYGREGMLAWVFHRLSAVGIWLFVMLHVLDIYLAGGNPAVYDDLLKFYGSTFGRILEVLLGAALLYHALNGLRILIMDFWPWTTRYHRVIWYVNWIIFIGFGIPAAFIIMRPVFGI